MFQNNKLYMTREILPGIFKIFNSRLSGSKLDNPGLGRAVF